MSVVQVWPPVLVGGVVTPLLPPPPPQAASMAPVTSAAAKGRVRVIGEVNMVSAPELECDAGCSACTWMPSTGEAVQARTDRFNRSSECDAGAQDPRAAAPARVEVAARMAGEDAVAREPEVPSGQRGADT